MDKTTETKPTIEELLQSMENELGSEPHVMKLISKLDEDVVFEHSKNKQFAMGGKHIPMKYKLLINIAVSVALSEESCAEVYTRVARRKGVSVEEIVEAIKLARFVKATNVLNTATKALEFLVEDK